MEQTHAVITILPLPLSYCEWVSTDQYVKISGVRKVDRQSKMNSNALTYISWLTRELVSRWGFPVLNEETKGRSDLELAWCEVLRPWWCFSSQLAQSWSKCLLWFVFHAFFMQLWLMWCCIELSFDLGCLKLEMTCRKKWITNYLLWCLVSQPLGFLSTFLISSAKMWTDILLINFELNLKFYLHFNPP